MNDKQIYFKNKKILIYGFGKSGIACFNFLKKNIGRKATSRNYVRKINKLGKNILIITYKKIEKLI